LGSRRRGAKEVEGEEKGKTCTCQLAEEKGLDRGPEAYIPVRGRSSVGHLE